MKNDVKYIQQLTKELSQQSFCEVLELTDPNNVDERFYAVADYIINGLKEKELISPDISLMDTQTLFLVVYCMGKVVERQRQKSPIANYIKEKEMIGVHYTINGQEKSTFVPESFDNKQIKKVISSIEGQEFKGNFKKLSEFEMKKTLKNIDEMRILN